MKPLVMRMVCTLAIALSACGGGSDNNGEVDAGGGGNTYACDYPGSGVATHFCNDYTYDTDITTQMLSTLDSACTGGGGTVVTACDTTSAVGGCQTTITGYSQIVWHYDTDSAAALETQCTDAGGTWVTP